jgi:TorA maturation chaperone TorD
MKTEDFLAHEQSRMDVYRFLADCFQLPNENLKKNLIRLTDTINTLCGEVAQYVHLMKKDFARTDDLESLKVDYARLFVGPYTLTAPPFGSVYLEGKRLIMGNSTVDAQKRYRQAGLDMAEGFREAPDHITVELEFMYFLIFKEIEAVKQSDIQSFQYYLKEQQFFLKDHLNGWRSEFTDNVIAYSETEFYKALAKFTAIFIQQDLQRVKKYNKSEILNEDVPYHCGA